MKNIRIFSLLMAVITVMTSLALFPAATTSAAETVTNAVAEIAETGVKYDTLEDAVSKVANGQTIRLLKNYTIASGGGLIIDRGISFTIDGKGYTVTNTITQTKPATGTLYVKSGTVTIKDLTVNTTSESSGCYGAVISRGASAKVILNGCSLDVSGTTGMSAILVNDKANLTFEGENVVRSTLPAFILLNGSTVSTANNGKATVVAPQLAGSISAEVNVVGITLVTSGSSTDAVAIVGSTAYNSLVSAFEAAREGDTIKLLDNINVATTGSSGRINCYAGGFNITLDGNGKKISSVADVALAFRYKATSGEDNGGVCRITVKDLSVECNSPSGVGTAIQTNSSTAVTFDGCDIRTKGSNSVGAVVVQPSSKFIAKGGTTITADTGYAIRLNDAAAEATIYDATIVADHALYSNNVNTSFNVREGALLDSRSNTLSPASTAGTVFNMTGGKIRIAATDKAVIEAPNTNFKINLFGGSFEGGNAIYKNAADSKKNIAYSGAEKKATFLPEMTKGASVRLVSEASGIRFETIIPKSLIEHANSIKDNGTTVSYGTIITPKIHLDSTDGLFTMEALDNSAINGAKYQRIIATDGITDEEDGSIGFRASLINIRLDNYLINFAARGYISYTVNGSTEYVYADYNSKDNARSIMDVTYAAMADVKSTAQGIYTTPVTSYLKLRDDGVYTVVKETAYSRFDTVQLEILNKYYNGEMNYTPSEEDTLSEASMRVASNLKSTFRQLGRGYVRNSGLACDFTCTGIEFNAYCAGSVYMKVNSSNATYWTVYVDGVRQQNRVLSNPSSTGWIELAYGLPLGDHKITIVKQSQFTMSTNEILEVKVKGRFNQAPANKEVFLEFYGDSILNGSNIHTGGTSAATSDGTLAFGWLTAQALGADCNIIGRGGLGVINPASGGYCMMDIYDLNGSRFVSGVTKYNFERKPDAIVVELGINDKVQKPGVDAATYTDGIKQFVSAMREKYGKDVPIVWLYGYSTSDYGSTMVSAINALKAAGDSNLYYCEISPCNVLGASDAYHPDVAKAKIMAAEVTAHLKSILNIK